MKYCVYTYTCMCMSWYCSVHVLIIHYYMYMYMKYCMYMCMCMSWYCSVSSSTCIDHSLVHIHENCVYMCIFKYKYWSFISTYTWNIVYMCILKYMYWLYYYYLALITTWLVNTCRIPLNIFITQLINNNLSHSLTNSVVIMVTKVQRSPV